MTHPQTKRIPFLASESRLPQFRTSKRLHRDSSIPRRVRASSAPPASRTASLVILSKPSTLLEISPTIPNTSYNILLSYSQRIIISTMAYLRHPSFIATWRMVGEPRKTPPVLRRALVQTRSREETSQSLCVRLHRKRQHRSVMQLKSKRTIVSTLTGNSSVRTAGMLMAMLA